MKKSWVYILTNKTKTVLYIGVTSDLPGRIEKHINSFYKGFASKYGCKYLIYYEEFDSILDAIDREKVLKGWRRDRKETIINSTNPSWASLNDKVLR